MSGKSFKGNLEVLNLSDIFQSLAMNRHSGTLIVTDGKREKKIFFAEGEITLLSSSRRQRLGELLVSEGKITEEDLELALKLQKQARKRLGEILVEEGFVEDDDIDRMVRHQIEEEIYDLFLWRKAEFEFIADQMPEDMARESPNLTRLAFNTNSLIMEALRRLDEWSLIRDLVPSTKEVFVLTNEHDVEAADVPARIAAEAPELINGKTSVEGLAEKFFVSEFELCKHLGEMVQAGVARALTQEELADRAEECYALNDFQGAAALYGRLAEYFPDQPKILTPLADSLRRTGAEKQSLAVYEVLAELLEGKTRESDRLRQVYEAITQLDPGRTDLARKLEDLHLRAASKPRSATLIGPLLVVAVLAAVGGGIYTFKDELLAPSADAVDREKRLAETWSTYNQARQLKDYETWFRVGWKLLTEFSGSDEAKKVELPLLVETEPAGFVVYINDAAQDEPTEPEQRMLYKYRPSDPLQVDIRTPLAAGGGEPTVVSQPQIFDDPDTWMGIVRFRVVNTDRGSIGGSLMGYDAGLVWSESLSAYLAPSRDGELRAVEVAPDGGLKPKAKWEQVRLGQSELGDVLSPPRLIEVDGKERLLVGAIEGGLLSLDLDGAPAPENEHDDLYPAASQVVGRPLAIPTSSEVPGGRVIFGTLKGNVYAYPLAGRRRAWQQRCEAPLDLSPALLGQRAVFVGRDHNVYAFDVRDGRPAWRRPYASPAPLGPPLAHADGVLLSRGETELVILDGASGQPSTSFSLPEGARVVRYTTDPSGTRVYVLTTRGSLVALDRGPGGLVEAWTRELRLASTGHGVLSAARPGRVLIAAGYPTAGEGTGPAVVVLHAEDGHVTWQASFQSGSGRVTTALIPFREDPERGWEFVLATTARTLLRFEVVEYEE